MDDLLIPFAGEQGFAAGRTDKESAVIGR